MIKIDGVILKQMIISGANNLYNSYPEVDALNVFPVPDGDTGTNMNLTISSGAKEVANKNETSIYEIAKTFSRGLLMGARGNSGVILSQIFRGFAQGLKGKDEADAIDLADAFMMGKEVAYKAVIRPVEGTILTVCREAAQALNDAVEPEMPIDQAIDILLAEARESLKRTPDLLPILKEVGVVDSGGAGFCKILEGFSKALKNEVVEKNMPDVVDVSDQAQVSMGNAQSKIQHEEFGYCTEFILKLPAENEKSGKKVFVEKRFVAVLNSHGNSIVEVRDNDLVKVHIHTLNPGNILSYAQQFGEFVKIKVENMSEQHSELLKEENNKKVEEKPLKEFGLISVGVGQGIVDMFKDLRVDYVVSGGQTMNPSTEDFVEAIKEVHAKNIIILPNNSNIVMAASQACDVVSGGETNAVVIPSKTIPQGLVAAMMFNSEVDMEVNINEMTEALSTVKTGQVTFSIKDTTVDGVQVYKDQFMGIFDKEIVCCQKDKVDAAMELLDKMTDSMSSIITVIIGEDVSNEEEERITNLINEKYGSEIDIDIKKGLQPVYSFIISVE